MTDETGAQLPPVAKWWIALYSFAAIWLLLVASLDASHFGPGFFPLLISLALVPLLAIIFAVDVLVRIIDAIQGTGASPARRFVPLVVALVWATVYVGICVLFVMEQAR